MSKALFRTPSQGDVEQLADFAELCCVRDGQISQASLNRLVNQVGEPPSADGIEDEESDSVPRAVESAFRELARRSESCGADGYPFELQDERLKIKDNAWNHRRQSAYLFMLFATCENMSSNRIVQIGDESIDGTAVFEEFVAHVCHRLFTGNVLDDYSGYKVFGPVARAGTLASSFSDCINDVIKEVHEGGCYEATDPAARPQDGGLDTFHWRTFADRRSSTLLYGTQCKTGRSWDKGDIAEACMDRYWRRWTQKGFELRPLSAFCVSRAIALRWDTYRTRGCLLLDRCRLTQYWGLYWWEQFIVEKALFGYSQKWSAHHKKSEVLGEEMNKWCQGSLERSAST